MKKALIVGSGFSGSVCARELAENGFQVTIIEKNNHIGGNAFDENVDGIYVHKYGPHIFHTMHKEVYEYLSRFTEWFEFKHNVKADIRGTFVPVPFNLTSLHELFEEEKANRIEKLLVENYGMDVKVPIMQMKQNENQELREFADFVFENVFLYYTTKQWGRKIEELDPNILTRVPVYISYKDGYFTDTYQVQPLEGYTKIFERMLDHKNIKVVLNTQAEKVLKIVGAEVYYNGERYDGAVVFTGPIDEFLNNKFGALKYRSLKFDYETHEKESFQPAPVVNYTVDKDYTRISEFKKFTTKNPPKDKTIIVKEYPLEYVQNKGMIAYYPIPNSANNEQFKLYVDEVAKIKNFYLLGRLGSYKYINMDVAIKSALELAKEIIAK